MNWFKKKKYFIIFFIANSDKGQATGNFTHVTNLAFIRNKCIEGYVKELNPDLNLSNIVVTGIFRLSKSEHEEYNKK